MTSPTLVYRELTLNFARAVTANQTAQTIQVVVTPLSTTTSVPAGATFVEAPVAREVLLNNETNTVVFRLVPTDLSGLAERLLYRIAWRTGGATGRTFTYDFAMPDADITFEQLNSLDYVIGGEVYLQQTDLGKAGRVARLNDAGQVIDAFGTPVAGAATVTSLENALNAEKVERQAADNQTRTQLTAAINSQVNQIITTTTNSVNTVRSDLTNVISQETAARLAGDAALTTALAAKPDLVNGKIPASQIPDSVRTQGIQVANQAAMLALTTSQVQQFDFAIRPDGVFALLGTDPSQLSNWAKLNKVSSVNGRDGEVVLALSDLSGSITQSQVTGLSTALAAKADNSALSAINTRVGAIETDTTIVKTVGGVIPNALNDSRMAYVDASGQFITRKDGTIISGAGGAVASVNSKAGNVVLTLTDVATAGGAVPQSQVTGLATTLLGKVDTTDSRLADSRTPTSHASSHASGGSDPLTLATSQVTGLATTLSSYGNRLNSLESRVTAVESGGGGGGGGGTNVGTLTWWSAVAPTGNFGDLVLHSPFGYNPSNAAANLNGFYFNPAGADAADVRFPYITPNGHLELRKWDESAPTDPALATQNSLDALTTVVNGKADLTAFNSLSTTVAAKANQSALDSLTTTVNAKASQSALDSLTTTVNGKASQASVDAKADQSALDTTNTTVASLSSQLANKATLTNGVLDLTAIPTLPQSRVTALTTSLAAKADLVNSVVPVAQIPTGIPQANITNLVSTLAAKADLVDGKLASSQLPSLALTSVVTKANRAAMLAQTSTDVQPGDICVITATADQGSYILTDPDPTQFANWTLLTTPLASVSSVNGQTGTVVLTASSVGALAADASIPQSQITNLSSTLATKVDTSAYNTALGIRPTWSSGGTNTLEAILSAAAPAKQRATYVAVNSVPSLSGQQTVDGVTMPLGSTVLLTAQSSSVLNGIWQVNSSAWTRVTDMASGSYLVRGTVVVIASGNTNANTLWQVTSASGVVDTAINNWTKIGSVGSTYTPTGGSGISISGVSPTQTFAVQPAPATQVGTGTSSDPYVQQPSGISVSSSGVAVDTSIVARKFVGTVPSGTTTPRVYHNLNTRRVLVQVIEASTGVGVLVGWQASGPNYVDLEFSTAPSTGQWAVIVIG